MRILFLVAIIVIILVLLYRSNANEHFAAEKAPQDYPLYTGLPLGRTWYKSFADMSAGERVQFIIDNFYSLKSEDNGPEQTTADQNAWANSLPTSANCADKWDACPVWAQNGECTINPEFMLWDCASSCQSCALTDQNKNDLTYMYNSRPVNVNVYHGEPYPGQFTPMLKMNIGSNG